MKKILTLAMALTAATLLTATAGYCYNSYLNNVNSFCGANYGCGLCHVDPGGGGPLNTDGSNWKNSGKDNCYFCPEVCQPPAPACTDADGDGYYAEAGCGTSVDCNDNDPEINPGAFEVCGDGKDNDCDGRIDCADNECDSDPTCLPPAVPEVCNDGIDNDGDGMVDCADGDCLNDPSCTLEGKGKTCKDGIDNDGDGLIDCDDPDCQINSSCTEGKGKSCWDGIDNDGDGLVDCDDPDCYGSKACR